MSDFESKLKKAVDKFLNYPGKYASTAYPMAIAQLEYDLRNCLNEMVESFNDCDRVIYDTTMNRLRGDIDD
jgi:hypothetical protein